MESIWDVNRGKIFATGGLMEGAVFCRGYNMMTELVGKTSFLQVLILNVTGRLVERRVADWVEGYFICVSYPDPRIWCNQIGSLAGSARTSPIAAVTAGVLASDSHLYGPGNAEASARFIQEALLLKTQGYTALQIVELHRNDPSKSKIIGYNSRPIFKGDERIVPLQLLMKDLGFPVGPHLQLVHEIEQVMGEKTGETINVLPFRTAFLSDQGFSPEEQSILMSQTVFSGVTACYTQAMNNPPDTFFPLRCEDIDYQGVPVRTLAR